MRLCSSISNFKGCMKKKTLLIKTVSFALIMVISLCIADKVCRYKVGTAKFWDFYEEKQQFDVLFFGSSRVLDSFQPMELWDKYKIRSYNLAQHGESLGRDYWQLKNALEHHVPRAVVMDVSAYYGIYQLDPGDSDQRGALHQHIDHIPLSVTKLKTIWNLCPKGSRAEYVFPFILYHSRWNELDKYDWAIKKNKTPSKGADALPYMIAQPVPVWDDNEIAETLPFESLHIDDIRKVCEEYGVELIFVNVPYSYAPERMAMLNYISKYLNDEGFTYLNYQRDADFISYDFDFADPTHLNVAGSIKLTDAFGKFFVENYGVTVSEPETEAEWNELLNAYREGKDTRIIQAESFADILMLAYCDDDYEVKVLTSPERMHSTGTDLLYPEMKGIEGCEGYRIEVYQKGGETPIRVYETQ